MTAKIKMTRSLQVPGHGYLMRGNRYVLPVEACRFVINKSAAIWDGPEPVETPPADPGVPQKTTMVETPPAKLEAVAGPLARVELSGEDESPKSGKAKS